MATRTKYYLLKLTPDEHESFKLEAGKLGISMADFMRLLFRQWVDGIKFERDKSNDNNGQDV